MKKILVVDDEDHIREIAATSLEVIGGWQVITARGGSEALSRAERERPDAILLDVMMPDMDGPSVFKALRANEVTRTIPVILLTAKVQPNERARFTDLGVDGVLAKPFDPMTLHQEVAAALGWTG